MRIPRNKKFQLRIRAFQVRKDRCQLALGHTGKIGSSQAALLERNIRTPGYFIMATGNRPLDFRSPGAIDLTVHKISYCLKAFGYFVMITILRLNIVCPQSFMVSTPSCVAGSMKTCAHGAEDAGIPILSLIIFILRYTVPYSSTVHVGVAGTCCIPEQWRSREILS